MKRIVLSLFALTLLAGAALPAHAIPPILRPGTRPMWASGGFGPGISLEGAWGYGSQFKLVQTFGYHFSGTAVGPAIAIDLQESFGYGAVLFELVPNFVWDIQIIDGLGLYLSPGGGLGFAHVSAGRGFNGLSIQLTFKAKLMLGDRGMVFVQPFGLDILGADYGYGFDATVRWDMLLGGGVTF